MRNLYKELIDNGGFTAKWNNDHVTDRYIVAITNNKYIIPTDNTALSIELSKLFHSDDVINYYLKPEYCFGGWVDDQICYLDINTTTNDLRNALVLGIRFGQKAIYDQVNKKIINVPTPQITGTLTQQKDYLIKSIDKILQNESN